MGWSSNAVVIQLQLQGQRAVVAGLAATSTAMKGLQGSVRGYASAADEGQKRSWLFNQALFTMRRYAYAGTLALTALAGASVMMGFKFNASMEMNQMAFTQFLGSAKLAHQELNYLYNLAKYTPFEFSNVTSAARRFLAFGYTLKDTNKYLQIIGDTAAAFGGGDDLIERMVLVFGQIRASGRLLGQDMLQLEQQGVPVLEILQKQLGLTANQLGRIGALGIPARIGIPALMRGMHEMFAGMAIRQAQTLNGQLSTLHDNLSQLMGALTLGPFNKARKGLLPGLNHMFDDMTALIKKQNGRITIAQAFGIAEKHYPWIRPIADITKRLITLGQAFWNFFMKVLWPAIKIGLIPALTILIGLMIALTNVLNALSAIPGLKYVLAAIIMILATELLWMKLIGTIAKFYRMFKILQMGSAAGGLFDVEKMTRFEKYLMRIGDRIKYVMGGRAAAGAGRGFMAAIKGARTGLKSFYDIIVHGFPKRTYLQNYTRIERALMRIRRGFVNAGKAVMEFAMNSMKWIAKMGRLMIKWIQRVAIAMVEWIVANPVLAIIAGVVALVALLVILYYKWGWFHKTVDKTWHWIKNHWKLLAVIILEPFVPMIAFFVLVITHIKTIIGWVKTLIGWIKSAWDWLNKLNPWTWIKAGYNAVANALTPNGPGMTPATAGAPAPGAYRGGRIPVTTRSQIQANALAAAHNPTPQLHVTVHSTLNVDGKKMADNNAKHRLNQQARRTGVR